MNIADMLRGFEFTAEEYARDPSGVVSRAAAYGKIRTQEEKDELERYLQILYTGKTIDSVNWDPLSRPLQDGGRLTGRVGDTVLSGIVMLTPKTISVMMDLPRRNHPEVMSLQLIYPAIFTEEPWDGSPANDYGVDAARRLLVKSYYGSLGKKR